MGVQLGKAGLVAASFMLAGFDETESSFVTKCQKELPDIDCTCLHDVAKDTLSEEHFGIFIDIANAEDMAAMRAVTSHFTPEERTAYEEQVTEVLSAAIPCRK